LATKCGQTFDPDSLNSGGLSRYWVTQSIEASLRRLGVDHVDLLYFHREDLATCLDESLRAIEDAIRAGKVRYFGLSNFRAWRHAEVVHLCRQIGMDAPIASQPYYNAFNRMPETEVLPACAHYGMGVVPYSPVARGVLTGKYRPGEAPPADTRAGRADKRMMQTEFREESLKLAQDVVAYAQRRGMSPAQFAVGWVLGNPLVTSTIVGPRTVEQMDDYLGGIDHEWTDEDEALINRMVSPGHATTPGYNDPAYPIEGRPLD
jgi:aryl-alcohol dehydrogenase (NADP+)